MTARILFVAVTVGGLCAAPVVGAGQRSGQQPPVFRSNTELVEIDVVAVDKAGNRVHGLTRDDFILTERRTVQDIETFTEIRGDVAAVRSDERLPVGFRTGVASNSTSDAGRLVILVLDDLHVWQGRSEIVKDIATKIVNQLDPASSMALIQTGGDHSVEVTSDRTRLLEAISRFKGRRPVRRPLENCTLRPIKRDLSRPEDFDPGCDIQDAYSNRGSWQALGAAARVLIGADRRRKAFVFISESTAGDKRRAFLGRSANTGQMSEASAYYGTDDTSADPAGISVDSGESADGGDVANMLHAMQRANITTYAIDPRGLVTPQEMLLECLPGKVGRRVGEFGIGPDPCEGNDRPGPQSFNAWVRQAQEGLNLFADSTGGFAVTDTDDFDRGISNIVTDIDNFYLLGFYPADTTTKGFRPVRVEVRGRPDLTLRYRQGYELIPDDDKAAARNARRDPLHVLIDHPLPSPGLPLRLHAMPLPHSGDRSKVAIALELTLPRSVMMSEADLDRLLDDIQYGVYALDLNGVKVRESFGSRARVALRPRPGLVQPPEQVTYQIAMEMELPAGQYQLRASAVSQRLGRGGSVYLTVDVPDFTKDDLAISDLLIGYGDGLRVPVARHRREITTLTATRPTQVNTMVETAGSRMTFAQTTTSVPIRSSLPFEPTLDRTFSTSDSIRLYFKTAQRRRLPALATISALTADGQAVVSLTRELTRDGDLDLRLPLAQLAPGAYRLKVDVADGRAKASRELGFLVR